MKTNSNFQFVSLTPRNRKPSLIANKRWAAYATAGAATALVAGSNSAEASIHYFIIRDKTFGWPRDGQVAFQLDHPGDSFFFNHGNYGGCNTAGFFITNLSSLRAGFRAQGRHDYYYVSKLNFGQNISSGSFLWISRQGRSHGGLHLSHLSMGGSRNGIRGFQVCKRCGLPIWVGTRSDAWVATECFPSA